jgi:hypothetical protein
LAIINVIIYKKASYVGHHQKTTQKSRSKEQRLFVPAFRVRGNNRGLAAGID